MGNDEVSYKVLRASAIIWFYAFGSSSKDHIIDLLESFDDPMRIFQFVTNFAVTYYQLITFAKTPYTLKVRGARRRGDKTGQQEPQDPQDPMCAES